MELLEHEKWKDRDIDPNMVCNCLSFGKGKNIDYYYASANMRIGYEKHMIQLADKDFDVSKFGEESKALVHGRDVIFIHHVRKCFELKFTELDEKMRCEEDRRSFWKTALDWYREILGELSRENGGVTDDG